MYLSRLVLNPRHRGVQRDLANPYGLHRSLMSAFAADLPREERVLYRLDADRHTGVPTVLVQSHTLPDWSSLRSRKGYLLPEPQLPAGILANPATKSFELAFNPGQALSFRLRANPTVRRDGSRHGLYKEEEQRAWLARKGQRNGFRVVRATAIPEGDMVAWKPRCNGKWRKLTFFAVRFEGVLQVTDAEALWAAVVTGIGSAKSFGFGLLSLAPPRIS